MEKHENIGISAFWLKIIACVMMTMDHVALLFIQRGTGDIPTSYYLLRAIGKMAFPIFAFLAVEGAYKSRNIKMYLLRLGSMAILLDGFAYAFGAINNITIASNPILGNAFTDLFMGVVMISLLRRKDRYSLLAVLPLLYEIFSDFVISDSYGTLFKSDWGTFSIILFLFFFIAREATDIYLKRKAVNSGLEEDAYILNPGKSYQLAECVALVLTEAIFYLIYRLNYSAFVIPNEFVPIGTYSTLAGIFILLYNGKRGFDNKVIKYSFYAYYPLHLIILGIMSMCFGVLADF